MKLYSIIDTLRTLWSAVPNAGTDKVGDVYDFNAIGEVDYPAFCITQQEVTDDVDNYTRTFHFNLFTFDRLTDDRSNEVEAQSHSIQILRSVIDKLEESGTIIQSAVFHPFTERFADECAGAYVDLMVEVEVTDCGDYELHIDDIELFSTTITENGTYESPKGTAYNKVIVNVPQSTARLSELTKTLPSGENTYTYTPESGYDGFSKVTINVEGDEETAKQIEELTEELAEANETISEQTQTIADKDSEIATKDATIASKDTEISNLNKSLSDANSTIASQQTTINEKTAEIEEKEAQIEQKDATITSLNATITELNNTIADKDSQIATKDSTITSLNATIADLQAQLADAPTVVECTQAEYEASHNNKDIYAIKE